MDDPPKARALGHDGLERNPSKLPNALLSLNRSDLPEDLVQEMERMVVPFWRADGIASGIGLDDIEILVTANADLNASTLTRLPSLHLIVTTEGIRRRSTMWIDTVRSELAGVPRNRITFDGP